MRVKDAVGRYGEQVAVEHLRETGLAVLSQNWRCRDGELDIVGRDGSTLVFVEVKTRSSTAYGTPAEAVNRIKQHRIRRLAVQWIAEYRDTIGPYTELRFDVVAVIRHRAGPPDVTHLRSAF
jgi:putative endonuclease